MRDHDRVVEPPPKQVLLSRAHGSHRRSVTLGPSYAVVTDALATPAAVVIDSREEHLEELVQQAARATARHRGAQRHPSVQPMAPAALLDLGADTYLAPLSLPVAAHVGVDPLVDAFRRFTSLRGRGRGRPARQMRRPRDRSP